METTTPELKDIMTRKTFGPFFEKTYPDLGHDARSVNWAIIRRKENGLEESGAILYASNRIRIHVPNYIQWLTEQLTNKAA